MRRYFLAVMIAILPTPEVLAGEFDLYDIRFRKVTDGVFVAYRPEPLRPYVEGNVTVIINDEDVIVVDASGSPRAARKVIAEIRKRTSNPVRFVIHTHIHRDHRFGVQEYVNEFPGVEIVAHPIVREVISKSGDTFVADTIKRIESRRPEQRAEIERLKKENKPGNEKIIEILQRFQDRDIATILEEYRGIRNLAPTLTFDQKLTLHRGARTIELLFLGKGDTDHDIVVYLPEEKVVVAGDMVVHPFPYGFSTNPVEWVETLRKLAALDFNQLVPGHGDVQNGKTYLLEVINLISAIHAQVSDAVAAGKTLAETRAGMNVALLIAKFAGDDPVKRYFFEDYFLKPAIEQAYKTFGPARND